MVEDKYKFRNIMNFREMVNYAELFIKNKNNFI